MTGEIRLKRLAALIVLVTAMSVWPRITWSQAVAGIGPDSVETIPVKGFAAGSFWRSMFGDNYRDLWSMPIRVPVLHIGQYEGGLTPYKVGGGKQTKSLRMVTQDSAEYVFRPVYKAPNLTPDYRGSVMWKIFLDAGSASHPAANVAVVPLMSSLGFLQPNARLVFMPDDPRLGEFRKEFKNVLGTLEAYPTVPKVGRAFAGAVNILDAEGLLAALNKDASVKVDTRKLLKIRMLDMLVGDNDRHADQWRWAQLKEGGLYEPVARDRDKVFLSYEGFILGLARKAVPSLVHFDSAYSDPTALFENATNFDRRVLGGLDREVWESTATELKRLVTDATIDQMIAVMPREYASRSNEIRQKLRYRRDHLDEVALTYYDQLFRVADVHATDTADVATIVRQPDGSVDVGFTSRGDGHWFQRHYDPAHTQEIRVYLHGGDDSATVSGSATGIPVRVIGGNGSNALVNRAGGRLTRLYDQGSVDGVHYGRNIPLEIDSYVDALNAYYNRRPMVHAFGREAFPEWKDYGAKIQPVFGLKTGHKIGAVPKIGVARYVYGFRKVPYASMIQADVGLSTGTRGWRANLIGDKRFESSDFHLPAIATMSQLEVVQFRGLGNDVEDSDDEFFDVKQTQWSFYPGIGYSFFPGSELTIGPIVRSTRTDSTNNNFLALTQPYGFSRFSQAGVQMKLHFDSRIEPDTAKPHFILDFTGSGYPGMWDAETAYESLEGFAAAFINIPFATKPVIALRGGGKKLYGNFPYFDAAFIGGGRSFRVEHTQRFAGDASLYGNAELRVPLFKFPTIVPTDVGALAFTDAAKVYVDDEAPGGWHTAMGGGFWVGAVNATRNVNVLFTNRKSRRMMVSLGFAF
ncbi:MAG TPA: hypothetical protein VFD22_11700 [Gemmatimonadaceae bacterium]|nr:hypothetical protein [Gemmatimonadaceae bacterium]